MAAAFMTSMLRLGVSKSVPAGEKQESWLLALDSAMENFLTGTEIAVSTVTEGFRRAFTEEDRCLAGRGKGSIDMACDDVLIPPLVFGRATLAICMTVSLVMALVADDMFSPSLVLSSL